VAESSSKEPAGRQRYEGAGSSALNANQANKNTLASLEAKVFANFELLY
jgi:hypothetical protein